MDLWFVLNVIRAYFLRKLGLTRDKACLYPCMDGRVHPVAWLYALVTFRFALIDAASLAGPVDFLVKRGDGKVLQAVFWRGNVSVNINGARWIGIVCHSDCKGHTVESEEHRLADLRVSMQKIKEWGLVPQFRIFGLYIECDPQRPHMFGRVTKVFRFNEDGEVFSANA